MSRLFDDSQKTNTGYGRNSKKEKLDKVHSDTFYPAMVTYTLHRKI